MKKLVILLFMACHCNCFSQREANVVKHFGEALQQWCATDDPQYFEKALKITVSKKKCIVDDKITRDFVENDSTVAYSIHVLDIYSYLQDVIQKAIDKGKQSFSLSNIRVRTDYVVPTAFKAEKDEIPSFVSADLALRGALNYDVTDLLYLREGKITKIIDYSSENSLGKAIELYSQKKYDDAFLLFRKLAYAEYCNFDAQYYLAVMEYKGQGCRYIDKKVRNKELAWLIVKNALGNNLSALNFMARVPIDTSQLDYVHFPQCFDYIIGWWKPMQSGLMMSYDEETQTCGFVNERGQLSIPYGTFSMAFPFHDGRALVRSKVTGKCGFIDERGNETVPMIYEDACSCFYKGLTWCVKDGDAYLVDDQGKVKKVIYDHPFLSPYAPAGKIAMLYKDESHFDIFDYSGNLCYEDYTEWTFHPDTGIVTMSKEGADDVHYRISW